MAAVRALSDHTHTVIVRTIHAHQGSARPPATRHRPLPRLPTPDHVGLPRPHSGHLSCPIQRCPAQPAAFRPHRPLHILWPRRNVSPSEHAPASPERPGLRKMFSWAQPLIHSHLAVTRSSAGQPPWLWSVLVSVPSAQHNTQHSSSDGRMDRQVAGTRASALRWSPTRSDCPTPGVPFSEQQRQSPYNSAQHVPVARLGIPHRECALPLKKT